jgi:hypothetical protein
MGVSSAWTQKNDHVIADLVGGGGGGGGVTTFSQDDHPNTDIEEGDLWFDTNDGNRLHWYDGTSPYANSGWIVRTGDLAGLDEVTKTEIDVAKLADISTDLGAISAGSINIGSGKFTVASDGTTTIKSSATGARVEIKNNVIKVYDGTLSNPRVQLGNLSA